LTIFTFAIAARNATYPTDPSYNPPVSVIVAARNEEKNLPPLLNSLAALDYPAHLLEIIIIDDRSTDGTRALIEKFKEAHPQAHLVASTPGTGKLVGKANALDQGIGASHGEILLFTDADCEVPKGWVRETVKYYADDLVGIVAGFTHLRGTRWFEKMQTLDWFSLFSVAAATAKMGFPVTAVGNNLSVRRKAYDTVGGYAGIPFSVTEDYALVHAIATSTGYSVRFPMDPGQLVVTAPCADWRELYNQKKRWFTGGRDMDLKSLTIYSIPYIFNVLILFSLLGGVDLGTWSLAFGAKLVVDFFLTLAPLNVFRMRNLIPAFPFYVLYYYVYVLIYPPLVLFSREIRWKGQAFTR